MDQREARRRQLHYSAKRKRWRVAHPIASAVDPGRPKPPKVDLPPVLTVDDPVLAEIVASYRDDPVTGWSR